MREEIFRSIDCINMLIGLCEDTDDTGTVDAAKALVESLQAALQHKGEAEPNRDWPENQMPVPRNMLEARGMSLMGLAWLKSNAPDQLIDDSPQPAVPDGKVLCDKITILAIQNGNIFHTTASESMVLPKGVTLHLYGENTEALLSAGKGER
jgi:hypothetical protein